MSDEPTYTLDEARRVMALRECSDYGHDWNIIENMAQGPLRFSCGRCGWSGAVTMNERPKK